MTSEPEIEVKIEDEGDKKTGIAILNEVVEELEPDPFPDLNLDLDNESQAIINENKTESKEINLETLDGDWLQDYVVKTMARQNYGGTLTDLDLDFYDKLSQVRKNNGELDGKLTHKKLDTFIDKRVDRLLHYATSFSDTVMASLSTEEKDMYSKLCEAVSNFRNELSKKLSQS